MDVETAETVEALRTDIHRVETSLTIEIGRVETSLTIEIGRVEASLTGKIDRAETSLTSRMLELHEDARRHTDVVAESLRDDIRMVAEGVVALAAKIDALRR